jgi:hypothetical protein
MEKNVSKTHYLSTGQAQKKQTNFFHWPRHFICWATTVVTNYNTNFIHISILMHFPCYHKFYVFHFIQLC